MKKVILYLNILIILLILVNLAFALTPEESKQIRACKKNCTIDEKNIIDGYKTDYNYCIKNCSGKNKQTCIFLCKDDKTFYLNKLKFIFENCKRDCINKIKNPDATCLSSKYRAGDIFLQDCSICRCDFNGKISCKKTPYCNFDKVAAKEQDCTNGFYHELCNGPYFDIVCSKYKYCICSGNNEYTCPEDYTCVKNFTLSINRRDNTIPGWKTKIGEDLGDIGVCGKNPMLTDCGNGVCDNVICKACDTAETVLNCPVDCS